MKMETRKFSHPRLAIFWTLKIAVHSKFKPRFDLLKADLALGTKTMFVLLPSNFNFCLGSTTMENI